MYGIVKFTKTYRNILRNASFQLRDNLIVKLKELSVMRNNSYNTLKETISSNELTKVFGEIKMETELLWSSTSNRHIRKYKRDNITVFSHQRKNGRFRKSNRRRHNNERTTIYRQKERRMTKEAKMKSLE